MKLTLDLVASRVARSLGNAESEREAVGGFDPNSPAASAAFKRTALRMYERSAAAGRSSGCTIFAQPSPSNSPMAAPL